MSTLPQNRQQTAEEMIADMKQTWNDAPPLQKKVLKFVGVIVLCFISIGAYQAGDYFFGEKPAIAVTPVMELEAKKDAVKQEMMKDFATIENQLTNAVKSKLNYPDTADFPFFQVLTERATVIDVDKHQFFTQGEVTAKNAFGVPDTYTFQITYTFVNGVFKAEKVNVFKV